MIINYAINSSDDNPVYLELWPLVKEGWLRLGIEPILLRISQGRSGWDNRDNSVYYLPAIKGIKTSFQAQISRIWAWKLFSGNLLLSDVDMLPINKGYFTKPAALHEEDEIISYCSDAAEKFDGYHPMCYILANARVMFPLIEQDTWESFVKTVAEKSGEGWSADQWWVTNLIRRHPEEKVISLKRGFNEGGGAERRIDRNDWRWDVQLLQEGYYLDAHLPRPYANHKESIDKLIRQLP